MSTLPEINQNLSMTLSQVSNGIIINIVIMIDDNDYDNCDWLWL